jgi:hypothetical protein
VARKTHQSGPARYFFVSMAFLFPIIALLGFVPSYLDMFAGQFHIHWFAHVHGILMTGWLLVFLNQTIFASKGRLKIHRQFGHSPLSLACSLGYP